MIRRCLSTAMDIDIYICTQAMTYNYGLRVSMYKYNYTLKQLLQSF